MNIANCFEKLLYKGSRDMRERVKEVFLFLIFKMSENKAPCMHAGRNGRGKTDSVGTTG